MDPEEDIQERIELAKNRFKIHEERSLVEFKTMAAELGTFLQVNFKINSSFNVNWLAYARL